MPHELSHGEHLPRIRDSGARKDPLGLVKQKGADHPKSVSFVVLRTNLVRIPQRTEARTREDLKQFTVMGFVVREVLRELVARADAERALLKACNRLERAVSRTF